MIDIPVDLSNLREAIGHDKNLEQALFEEFIESSLSLIAKLSEHLSGAGDNEDWRANAHALKGICINLGAKPMGDLTSQAQKLFESDIQQKRQILEQITKEREAVVAYLRSQ